MIKVFIKGANLKGYAIGFAFQPVVREVDVPVNLGDMKGVPDLGSIQFKKVQQQVLMPVAFVIMEDGRMGITGVGDIVPLISDEEKAELADSVVPLEVLEEAKKIQEAQATEEGVEVEQG